MPGTIQKRYSLLPLAHSIQNLSQLPARLSQAKGSRGKTLSGHSSETKDEVLQPRPDIMHHSRPQAVPPGGELEV